MFNFFEELAAMDNKRQPGEAPPGDVVGLDNALAPRRTLPGNRRLNNRPIRAPRTVLTRAELNMLEEMRARDRATGLPFSVPNLTARRAIIDRHHLLEILGRFEGEK
jgi:hypothetical protein